MAHIMFDLETWGTRPGSAIRSIGAVVFCPRSDVIGETFYHNICDVSCREAGLTVDPQTERWWAQQSLAAQESLTHDVKSLDYAVNAFHVWFGRQGGTRVWCQGANFDSVLWEAAAAAVGARVPWKFWNVRDTRTIYEAFGFNDKSLPRSGTYHNALDDAKHQALCVRKAFAMGEALS